MSTTVDQRVVEMQFDNRNFEKNVSTTMSTLDKLKQSLKLDGASKGFEDIGAAANGVNMSGLGRAVETVQAKFSALSVIGVTALANITNSAVNTGKRLVSSLSVDQITAGWRKFGEKTTSVATLVAQGNAIEDVNKQLNLLNWFTDETSYNFTDMVANIAKFTASGKGLDESVTAMEGIATWAALSGQNAMTASRAMYQLSQAMGAGVMRREDYRSIQNASMDTEEFRQKCLDAAVALGTLKDNGDGTYMSMAAGAKNTGFTISQFADNLTEGMWLTSDVMMKVFNDYSSAVSKIYEVTEEKGLLASEVIDEIHKTAEGNNITIDEAIKKLGYVDEAGNQLFDSFGLKAFEAAQKARTWGDAVDSVKDAVSTGWMNTFEIIFGNSEEATQLWTDLANAMWDVFAAGGEARNEMLKGWKELGGRDDLIEGFWNIWEGFFGDGDEYLGILGSIKEAFRDIFPPMTAERLAELTTGFKNFTERIKPSAETLDKLKRAFKGVFSIIDIGKKAITTILKPIGQLLGSEGFGSIGDFLLSTAADIGDFFTALNKGFETNKVSEVLSGIITKISSFIKGIFDDLGGFSGVFSSVGNTITKVAKSIWDAVTKVFGWIKENVSWGDILAGLTGGGIFVVFKKVSGFIDKIKETFEGFFNKDKGESIKSKFSDILDSVKESLQSFTSGIKVVSLIGIAASITLLSSSFKKISELDAKGIAKSLITIGVSLTMMMKALNAMPKNKSFVTDLFGMSESTNLVKSGVSLILMAEAIKILSDSIVKLSELSLSEIAKGLIGVGGGMVVLVKGLNAIKAAKIPIRTSIAMLALAESCKALGDAFAKFSEFSWDEIARGLVSMGGALGELVAAMAVLEKASGFSSIIGSAGILITIQGLGDLADTLKKFGEMNWDEIGKGLIAMGGALGELTVVLGVLSKISKISIGAGASGGITGALSNKLFGKAGVSLGGSGSFSAQLSGLSNIFSSGSIWITIQGLSKLAESLKSFGGMSWDSIGKGLSAMGGALAEVGGVAAAVGKLAGFSSILGAGSIWITIQGLGDLADSFRKFGSMPWSEIDRGLVGMGGALSEVTLMSGALGTFAGFSGILGGASIWVTIQGLDELANSMKKFGSMSWGEIGRGLAAMGGALLEIGVVTGALGYLTNFAGILGAGSIWIAVQGLDELANALKKFGEMDWGEIGRGLTAMGAALTEVAVGSLLNTLSGLGAISLRAVAEPLGALADSIKKWTDVDIPIGLGVKLSYLAMGVQAFTFGGLGAGAIALVAKPLGVMAESVGKWSGVTIPDGLDSKLSSLALGVMAFTFDGLGAAALSLAAPAIGAMAESVGKWSGVTVPDNLKEDLGSLADGVKAFSWAFLGGWSIGAIVEPLKSLAGSVRVWKNVSIPSSLGEDLSTLAKGVRSFSFAFLGGWSIGAVVEPLKSLAGSVTAWKGVSIPGNIGEQLGSLADGVEAFSFAFVGGWVLDDIVDPLGRLAGSMDSWKGVSVPDGIGTQLSELAGGVRAFTLDGLGASAISELADPLGNLSESVQKWVGVNIPDSLTENLENLAKGVRSFTLDGLGASAIGEVSGPLGELADSVGKWSSVTIPNEFSKNLGSLADGVGKFTLVGIGASAIASVGTPLGNLADSIKKWSGVTVPDSLSSDLTSLAEGVKAFEGISSVPTGVSAFEKINSAASVASGLSFSTIISGLNDLVSSLSNFESVPSSISGVGEAIINNIVTPLQSALPIISNAGIEIVNTLSTGITANAPSIQPASLALVSAMSKTISSKAKSLKSSGSTLATMFASGIRSGSSSARSAGSSLGSSASSGASAGYTLMYGSGSYIVDGLVNGINDNRYKVFNAVTQLANDLSEKFKITVQIGSPSKLFAEYGRFLDEGLAIGIKDNTDIPVTAASRLGESTIRTMQDAISKASDMFNFEGDLQPTIRPVVDLSDVKTGLSAIDGMFGAGKDLGVMANVRAISSSMNARSQNGTNDDIISAINKLGAGLENNRGDTYNFGDFTYDDGSNVADAVGTLIRYAKIGRRV